MRILSEKNGKTFVFVKNKTLLLISSVIKELFLWFLLKGHKYYPHFRPSF